MSTSSTKAQTLRLLHGYDHSESPSASKAENWDKTSPPTGESGWKHQWQWEPAWQVRVYGAQLCAENDRQGEQTHFAYLPVFCVMVSLVRWRLGNVKKKKGRGGGSVIQISEFASSTRDRDGERCGYRQKDQQRRGSFQWIDLLFGFCLITVCFLA